VSDGQLLSATVIALDEEERLPGCLASLGFCDEVLVIDGGSRDRTREVAAAAGARVLSRPFDDFARQHEFARTQARGAWVLSIDADERASPELASQARTALLAGAAFEGPSAYALPFKNHFRGIWLRHGGLWPDRHLRLFRRERCSYDPARPVHERLRVDGRTADLDAPILHFTWGSLAQCLAKSERYAEAAAQALHAQGRRAGALDLIARPLWRFLRAYVLRLGFLDGAPGAAMALARAHEAYARYARLWELSRFPGSGEDRLR
jgi:glycosyltransferase involved in cell wall biosynthesis